MPEMTKYSENVRYQIKVTLALLGMTGVLLLVGSAAYFINQISGKFHLS